jgi:hypothetical protein
VKNPDILLVLDEIPPNLNRCQTNILQASGQFVSPLTGRRIQGKRPGSKSPPPSWAAPLKFHQISTIPTILRAKLGISLSIV